MAAGFFISVKHASLEWLDRGPDTGPSDARHRQSFYLYCLWLVLAPSIMWLFEFEEGPVVWGLAWIGALITAKALLAEPIAGDIAKFTNQARLSGLVDWLVRAIVCGLSMVLAEWISLSFMFHSVADASTYDSEGDHSLELSLFVMQWVLIALVFISLGLIWRSGVFARKSSTVEPDAGQIDSHIKATRRDWMSVVLVGHLIPMMFLASRLVYLPKILRSAIDPGFRSLLVSEYISTNPDMYLETSTGEALLQLLGGVPLFWLLVAPLILFGQFAWIWLISRHRAHRPSARSQSEGLVDSELHQLETYLPSTNKAPKGL